MGLLLLTLSLRISLKKQGFLENKQTSKKTNPDLFTFLNFHAF